MNERAAPERRPGFRSMVPTRGELSEVVRLALPVAGVQVGMMGMGVVDTIMVGRVSPTDLAAIALGNIYFFAAVVFGMGVIMSLDPVVSQAVGAGDRIGVARAVQRGLLLALGLSLIAMLLLTPAAPILTFLRQPEDVIPVAAGYAHASIPGAFPFLAFMALRQTLQAIGRVAPIVWVIVAANLANVFFNWVLVFGHLGFSPMGAVGSGWASSLSRWFMLVGIAWVTWPLLRQYLRPVRPEAFQLPPLVRMVRLGAPIGIQLQLEFGAFMVVGILMGWLGTMAMAGHQVALNLASFTFMVPVGISQASAVLVGRAIGREDPAGARRAAGGGVLLAVVFMTATALLFLTLPHLLARIYTDEVAVLALAVTLIPVAGIFQVVDGLQVVAAGVLRGIGDTKSPMIVNVLGFWLVGMPVSLYLGFRTPAGPVGLWWGLAAGLGAVSVLLLIRVRHRMGRDLQRIVIDDEHPGPLAPDKAGVEVDTRTDPGALPAPGIE
jgi:MATE family multidrug resistance protein